MSARTTEDSYVLFSLSTIYTLNTIVFTIDTPEHAVREKIRSFIEELNETNIYTLSKKVRKEVAGLNVYCRVKLLNLQDYEIIENYHSREKMHLKNLNFTDELAGSKRTLKEIAAHSNVKALGFTVKEGSYIPFFIPEEDIDKYVSPSAISIVEKALKKAIES
jgi:hypothetical protein